MERLLRFENNKELNEYLNHIERLGADKNDIKELKELYYVKPDIIKPLRPILNVGYKVLHKTWVYSYAFTKVAVLGTLEDLFRWSFSLKPVKRSYELVTTNETVETVETPPIIPKSPKPMQQTFTVEGNYPLELLTDYPNVREHINHSEIYHTINETLTRYGIEEEVTSHKETYRAFVYYIVLENKTRVKDIEKYRQELSLVLNSDLISIGTFEGKVAITIPKKEKSVIGLKNVLKQSKEDKYAIPIGVNYNDEVFWINIDEAKHILCAGSSGGGKTNFFYSVINSLLYRNKHSHLKFYMADFKLKSLPKYNDIPHLVKKVAKTPDELHDLLLEVEEEMENRLVRNLMTPRIIFIIDELEDVIPIPHLRELLTKLMRKGREVGIYFWIATQSPYNHILPNDLKNNCITRVAFKTEESGASETILGLGHTEATTLLGEGDLYFRHAGRFMRLQAPKVEEKDISSIVKHLSTPDEIEIAGKKINIRTNEIDKEFVDFALYCVSIGGASVNMFREHVRNNYNRAKKVLDLMQKYGVCSEEKNKDDRFDMLMSEKEIREKFKGV